MNFLFFFFFFSTETFLAVHKGLDQNAALDTQSCTALTFCTVSTHISSFGAVTVGFSVCQRADPSVLAGIFRTKAHHLQAHFLTVDEHRQLLTPITEICDNSLERRQLANGGQGDGGGADVPRKSAKEEVTDDLHELSLGPHLPRLGLPVYGQAGPQIVPVDGGEVPAAVVDHLVGGDSGLRAVDADAELEPALGHREEKKVAKPAVVKIEQHAFWL